MLDRELQAMAQITESLEPLEAEEVSRVLRWALDRFGPSRESHAASAEDPKNPIADRTPNTRRAYDHITEVMEAVNPQSGQDRALAAGYWFQVVQGRPDFTGLEVNSALRNLGYGLSNVTTTLDSLIKRKPALVLQVAKGKAKMAHKRYKLTQAGVGRVEQLIEPD